MLTDSFFTIAQVGHDATLWVLVTLSVFSIAFIFERFIALGKVKRQRQRAMTRMREVLQNNSFKGLEDLTQDKESLEGRALDCGLKHLKSHGSHGLEEIFSSVALTERPRLERSLNFLATVGSNAPFIGLLGTVFGIMDAFRALATSEGDPNVVMIGISKALVATAVGLLVAIPAVIAYNYFQKQVRSTLQSLQGIQSLCIAYSSSSNNRSDDSGGNNKNKQG